MTKTLYVPDHVKAKLNNPKEAVKADRKELDKLPKPVGWRILVLPFKAEKKQRWYFTYRQNNGRLTINCICSNGISCWR